MPIIEKYANAIKGTTTFFPFFFFIYMNLGSEHCKVGR